MLFIKNRKLKALKSWFMGYSLLVVLTINKQ